MCYKNFLLPDYLCSVLNSLRKFIQAKVADVTPPAYVDTGTFEKALLTYVSHFAAVSRQGGKCFLQRCSRDREGRIAWEDE